MAGTAGAQQVGEAEVRDIITVSWSSPEFATKINEMIDSRLRTTIAKVAALEFQSSQYLRQVEAEVEKAKGGSSQAAAAVEEVKAHATFLDQKRTEIVEHNEQMKIKLIEFEKIHQEENDKIKKVAATIHAKSERSRRRRRNSQKR